LTASAGPADRRLPRACPRAPLLRRPPSSPPFPYTTPFRSSSSSSPGPAGASASSSTAPTRNAPRRPPPPRSSARPRPASSKAGRSEEHTSELQSLRHLVCRLLLEKKKLLVVHRQ